MSELDPRVIELSYELLEVGSPGGLSWSECRERIVDLHGSVSAETDRLALMEMHKALTDLAERNVGDDPERLSLLRKANETQYRHFLVVEAEGPDGKLNLEEYSRIIDREVEMGRMDPNSETYRLVKAGTAVFKTSEPLSFKKIFSGLLRRGRPTLPE